MRVQAIQQIGAVYHVYPAAAGSQSIPTVLKRRLEPVFARHQFFGGRDAELAQLDAFVEGGASGYVFVTGRSGYGKTALLVNWVRDLELRHERVCYHFVSRTDGFADADFTFRNLCQQLVAAHGLTGALPGAAVELRTLYGDLLRTPPDGDSKLVIVLDALDEAQGWAPGPDLFPDLPAGVIVVFSAREVAGWNWLDKLGLSRRAADLLYLQTLGTAEIVHLLGKAGPIAAQAADNRTFVDALWAKSSGDPFYLHFLIQDVESRLVTDENVKGWPTGLDAYLTEWWNQLTDDVEIDRNEAYDLLGVLTVARGPLRVDELARITPTLSRGALLNRELGGKLRRYLVGDAEAGFALCHPRFADYLQTKFSPHELQDYRDQLLRYCTRWSEHKSAYALSHYGMHLFELGRWGELFALISKAWMDAKFARDYSHRSFAADVELATEAVRRTEPTDWAQLGRGCLIHATLASSAAEVPAEALAALARLGQVAKALGYADLVQDPETHHAAYLAIAGALVESGASAEDVLRQALAAIPAIRDEQGRIEALESAIQLLAVARDGEGLGRALSIADTIENAAARALAFARIAAGLTEAGEPAAETVATSLAVAGSIEGDGSVRVLVGVAQVLAEQHLLEQASQALTEAHARAGALEDDVAKVRALSHVADGLATIRDAASLREVAFEIVTALERFAVVVRSAEATERLLSAINLRGRAGETQEGLGLASRTTALIDAIEEHHADADVDAQALARSVTLAEKSWAATALARLFVALTHADCDSAKVEVLALAAASDIEDDATMGTILETFVSALPKKDGKPFAADLADRLIAMMDVLDTQSKKGLLSALIPILRNAGEHARLVHAVSSALALADSDPNLRVEVVQMLAEAGDAERALVMADEIIEEKEKADALSRLAATLGRAGQYDQARGLAERIAIPADKAYAWAVVADSLAQAGQEVAASLAVDHALQAADAGREVWVSFQNPKLGMRVPVTLGREQAKADALTVVANALARAGAVDAALKVVDAVEKVGYPSGRATALCAVAKALIEVDDTDQGSDIALKAFLLAEALETSDALGVEAPNSVASTDDQHRHNRVSLGDVLAAELRDPEVRAQTLGWIAQVVASAGARADAVATIDRALASVEALPEEADRSRALFSVLPALATIGYEGGIARAQVVAQGIGDEETIRQVEVVRCEAGNVLPEDRSPYFTIPGAEHKKASALSQIAEALAGAGLDDKAEDAGMQALTLTTISEIEEVTGEVVMRVAPMFGKVRSLRGLDRVSEMARAIRGATIKARALIGVGRGFAALGNQVRAEEESDLALTIVESELDEATQAIAVSSIALNLAKAGRVDRARVLIDRALVIAEEIGDASEKSRAVAEITSRMDEMEYEAGRSRALAVAETIGTEASNAAALLSIAVAFAQAGRKERARQIAEHAVTTITRMQEPSEQAVALGALSNAFLQADANDRALEVAAMAFLAARRASRQTVFEVLGQSAAVIATIDQGETLVRLFGVLQEVDSWWS